jgi:hypothetical protein
MLSIHTTNLDPNPLESQPKVVDDICRQLTEGDWNITGVMIKSHINAGRQDIPPEGPSGLKHGVSVTDACVGWEVTVGMLNRLNNVSVSSVQSINPPSDSSWHRNVDIGCGKTPPCSWLSLFQPKICSQSIAL